MTRPVLRALGATAALGAAGFGWGLIEAALFTVRRVDLDILPPGGRSIRILHVSDVHLTTSQHFKLDFVRSMAALEPDLVVNTGDNIAQAEAIFPLLAAWNKLRLVPGVFVFGSNDYYSPHFRNPLRYLVHGKSESEGRSRPTLPWEKLRDGMTRHGWVDLTHRRAALEVNGYRLAFRGVDDAHLGRDDYAAVAGPPDPEAHLNIGVTHAPYLRLLDAMTADGMDLIFAGHTHGGQVTVPGYGALVTNCDLDPARVKGLSTHTAGGRTAHLHVSAGVGTSPYAPYRFACRPEVTLLTLRPVSR
ncbi:metallophosphoesterase [Tessaracoccus sp. Z1128]